MSGFSAFVHNPGSPEAVAAGCTCPVLDNNRGAGFPWGPVPQLEGPAFYITDDCPLHTQGVGDSLHASESAKDAPGSKNAPEPDSEPSPGKPGDSKAT